jgi:hypothetical protein
MPESPAIPTKKGRAEIIAKVERMQSAVNLAVENETHAERRCAELARQIDALAARTRVVREARQPATALEQELASLENQLSVEKQDLAEIQEVRKDALAELRAAERERDRYVEDVELSGASARFEGIISKANAVLTGLAGVALTTGYQVTDAGQQLLLAIAVGTAIAALALGLLSYLPVVIAASLDALRKRSAPGGALSYMVTWHDWVRWMQVVVLFALIGLVVTSWVFLARAFF